MSQSLFAKSCTFLIFLSQLATVKDFYITEANKDLEMIKTKMNSEDFHAVQSTLYGCFLNILAGYAGDAIEKCSAKYFGSANELPGGDLILPTTILDVFKKEIPNLDTIVKLDHEVTKIIWLESLDGVKIMVGQDEYLADFCISTLPPGVMNRFHQNLFEPKLPQIKIDSFASINPGAIGKYFVEWKQNWREVRHI